MNNPSFVYAKRTLPDTAGSASSMKTGRSQMSTWVRLLIALTIFVVLGLAGGAVWMFGILMFTFALDGASSSAIPNWLDPFMLVLWPASIALISIVPTVLTACKANWKFVLGAGFATVGLAAMVYVVGVVALFTSL